MKIEGTTKKIERVVMEPPKDGVHVLGKDGTIKGTRAVYIGDTLVPHGQVGFYWRIGDIGYKVYWSITKKHACSKKVVYNTFRFMRKMSKRGICPPVHKVKYVKVKLDDRSRWAYAIKMDHVHYPEVAWEKFSQGYPYDWNCLDQKEHPDHNPEGFNRFAARLKKKLKVGDVIYCTKKKAWFQVDCDESARL